MKGSFPPSFSPCLLTCLSIYSFGPVAAASDLGRRAVAIFLDWLRRVAHAQLVLPLLTCNGAFCLDFFVWPSRLRDARLVALPSGVPLDAAPLVVGRSVDAPSPALRRESELDALALHFDELDALQGGADCFAQSVATSRARYIASLRSTTSALRFAPLEHCLADAWRAADWRRLLALLAASPHASCSLDDALDLVAPHTLLLLLRCELLDVGIDVLSVRLPRAADRIALRQLRDERLLDVES